MINHAEIGVLRKVRPAGLLIREALRVRSRNEAAAKTRFIDISYDQQPSGLHPHVAHLKNSIFSQALLDVHVIAHVVSGPEIGTYREKIYDVIPGERKRGGEQQLSRSDRVAILLNQINGICSGRISFHADWPIVLGRGRGQTKGVVHEGNDRRSIEEDTEAGANYQIAETGLISQTHARAHRLPILGIQITNLLANHSKAAQGGVENRKIVFTVMQRPFIFVAQPKVDVQLTRRLP